MARISSVTKLSRERDQRKLLIKNLASSLAINESLKTTKAKAKLLIPYFEKLITKAKKGGLHNYRQVLAAIDNEQAAQKIFTDYGKRFKNRHGGYVTKKSAGWRQGDNAQMVEIKLTEQKIPEKQQDISKTKPKTQVANSKGSKNAKK